MLRDDAIREGLLEPTEDDVEKMKLNKNDIRFLDKLRKRVNTGTPIEPDKKRGRPSKS